jgi:hypothetical protein
VVVGGLIVVFCEVVVTESNSLVRILVSTEVIVVLEVVFHVAGPMWLFSLLL